MFAICDGAALRTDYLRRGLSMSQADAPERPHTTIPHPRDIVQHKPPSSWRIRAAVAAAACPRTPHRPPGELPPVINRARGIHIIHCCCASKVQSGIRMPLARHGVGFRGSFTRP
ncbi:Hypothetical protein TPAR_09767 [Tolypocladium paradoxum]|uniref:Uncharacterized protein n=1 Tax=Tolypocladium paradoxum TaxID=94208 RepID=A0A2S4L7Q7_9HYPO|nr:Hypothetical protein TPAR_09767 [Tolypocladium paradoxum]